MTFSMMVFDTETSGPEPEEARLVSAFLGLLAPDGTITAEQEWIVKPDGFVIPDGAIAVHGITNEHAHAHGRPLPDVLNEIAAIIRAECLSRPAPLGGHNICYDLTVLDRELGRVWPQTGVEQVIGGIAVLDSYVLDKEIVRYRRGTGTRKLVPLAAAYGVHLTEAEAHGARADALAAGRIIQKQLGHPHLQGQTIRQIHDHQTRWREQQSASLEKWFRTKAPFDRRDPTMVIDGAWPYIPRKPTTEGATP